MARPILVVVERVGDISGILNHNLYGVNPLGGADAKVYLDPVLNSLLAAGHLHGYDATAGLWVGVGHAATGKVMLDAAE